MGSASLSSSSSSSSSSALLQTWANKDNGSPFPFLLFLPFAPAFPLAELLLLSLVFFLVLTGVAKPAALDRGGVLATGGAADAGELGGPALEVDGASFFSAFWGVD